MVAAKVNTHALLSGETLRKILSAIEADDRCAYMRMRTEHRGADSEMKIYTEYPDHGEVSEALIHAIIILISANKDLTQELKDCRKELHDLDLHGGQSKHHSRDTQKNVNNAKSETWGDIHLHQRKETARMSYSEVCRKPTSGKRSNSLGKKFEGYGASGEANMCEKQEDKFQATNHSIKDPDVCWYYLQRRCKFGTKCRNSHIRNECRFFKENRCRFGEHCWFSHRENKKTSSEDEVARKANDGEIVIEQTHDKSATNIPIASSDPKQARKTNSLHEPRDPSIKVEDEALSSRKKKKSENESNASQEKEPKAEKVQTDVSGIVRKASKTSYKSREESENPIDTKEETAIEALDTGAIESNEESRKLEKSDKITDGKHSSNEENLPENEKDFDENTVVDIANAILPDSTKQISDLKSGKVWLELLNKISSQNYRTNQNGRKNYKTILKMLQETGKDATFLVEELDKVLSGDKKANFKVASNFIEILKQYEICNDYNVKDWTICEVIEDLFRSLKKGKDKETEAKEQENISSVLVDSD